MTESDEATVQGSASQVESASHLQEAALQELRTRLEQAETYVAAFRSFPISVVLIRQRDRRILEVSDCLIADLQITRDLLVGRTTTDLGLFLPPGVHDALWEALEEQGGLRGVYLEREGSQGVRSFLLSAQCAVLKGEPCVVAIATEISALKKTEKALQLSEERLRLTLEASRTGLWDWHVPTGRLVWDQSAAGVLGYSLEALAPSFEGFRSLVHPEDRGPFEQGIREHFHGEREAYAGELRLRTHSGTWRWASIRGRVVEWGPRRTPQRMVGTVTDIQTLRAANEAIVRSEARFRSLVHNLTDAIILVQPDGTLVGDTPSFQRMFGHSPESTLGHSVFEFAHPEDLDRVRAAFQEALEKKNVGVPTEFRARAVDGTWVTVEALGDNLVDQEGIGSVVVTLRDVSERKRAEEQRRAMESRIQHTQKLESLGVLAGGVAHDFNNLLTGVLGHASLALAGLPEDSPARRHLEQVRLAAQRASELTRQLLAYSGKGSFVIEPVSVSEILEEMTRLLEISISNKCELHSEVAEGLPLIQADASQVRQVVMNLILNASEAIGDTKGRITVTAHSVYCDRAGPKANYLSDSLEEGEYVCLEVADTGCGMPAEVQARVFDPFFTTKFTGRGLGLAAVLGIVRGHKGAIEVHSEVGQGTTFRVLFPVSQSEKRLKPPEKGKTLGSEHGLVLVVEQDAAVRALAHSVLKEAGYRVLLAGDGGQGAEALRQHPGKVSAVLLDATLPDGTGAEVLKLFSTEQGSICVILTGACSESEALVRSGELRVAGFLQKPYSPGELVEVLVRTLAGSER